MPRSRSMPDCGERGGMRPVFEHLHRAIEAPRHVRRDPERVLRVVVAGLRVGIRANAQAERREELSDARPREALRAFEFHVLDEVREPLLVVVFEHGAGFDDEAELGAPRRLDRSDECNSACRLAACRR